MNVSDIVDRSYLRTDIPAFRPGDTVRVHARVVEGGKERVQVFQGVVIGRRGGGLQETFTVRKISFGVGVERTFPVHSPSIAQLEVVTRGRVRRAKLYYLRDRTGRKARIRERRLTPEELAAEAAAAAEAARLAAQAPEGSSMPTDGDEIAVELSDASGSEVADGAADLEAGAAADAESDS